MEKLIKTTTKQLAKGLISINEADKILLGLFNVRKMLFDWQTHVNKLNGDEYGIPDNVEIDKFLSNYFA